MSIRIPDQATLLLTLDFLMVFPCMHCYNSQHLSSLLCLEKSQGVHLWSLINRGTALEEMFQLSVSKLWVAATLRTFNEALPSLSNYHKGALAIVQRGTWWTVPLVQSDKMSSYLLSFVPLSFLILLPTSNHFFIASIFLTSFPSIHFKLITLQFHLRRPPPPFFPIFQTVVRFPNLSAFMCFPLIKRSAKKTNIG